MTWKLASLLLVSGLGLPRVARAQDRAAPESAIEAGYTLPAAIDAMRRGHPLLVEARAAIEAATGDAVDAGLWTNPTLFASWTPGVVQSSYDPAGYLAWTVSQFVELADTPGARARAARLLRAATEAELEAVVVDLSLDLEEAFVAAAAARERLRALVATSSALHEAARIISERVTAGAAPQYDASRIALTVAMIDADVATAGADVTHADGVIRSSVGPAAVELHGSPELDLFEMPALPSLSDLLARLRAARPDLVALDRRSRAAEASVAVAQRSVFPGALVQLGAGFGQSPGQIDLTVGISVPIPIIDFGQGSIPASAARAEGARAARDSVLSIAELQLDGARRAAEARRRALAEYVHATASTDPAMRAEAAAAYVAGRMSVLELADAHLALRDSELRAIDLAVQARMAEIEIGRLVGGSLRVATSGTSAASGRGEER